MFQLLGKSTREEHHQNLEIVNLDGIAEQFRQAKEVTIVYTADHYLILSYGVVVGVYQKDEWNFTIAFNFYRSLLADNSQLGLDIFERGLNGREYSAINREINKQIDSRQSESSHGLARAELRMNAGKVVLHLTPIVELQFEVDDNGQ